MFLKALPFAISFSLAPQIVLGALWGGWWIIAPAFWGYLCITVFDKVLGFDTENLDPATRDSVLFWHKLVTWIWVPAQTGLILFCLWQAARPDHLSTGEAIALMLALGLATGGIGITFAHELCHQRNRWEQALGDCLLVSVAYGHFAVEHVFGHHMTVATPRDPVSARRGESLTAFLPRAVLGSLRSAWALTSARLARRALPVWHQSNPFWRYALGTGIWLAIAYAIGGGWGITLFLVQAAMAIYQLETVNYIEHYGLTRRYLGQGKFERVQPRHSWNAAQTFSNWMLINLQRHSDHHFRPDRRFPLLQHLDESQAPQLPFGYPVMILIAGIPALWFRIMNPKVDAWRQRFYPDIADWGSYEDGTIGREAPEAGTPAILPA